MDGTLENIDCIVLAGGMGTRLKSVVSDVPKPMAPINGVPFLEVLLNELNSQGLKSFVLATGYKTEVIQEHFSNKELSYTITYSIEDEPLGTGGAILKALEKAMTDKVLIINGDSFFKLNLKEFMEESKGINTCVLALKRIVKSQRYGSVQLSGNLVSSFEEKVFREEALINAGVYLLDREWFLSLKFPEKFSFETSFLEVYSKREMIHGIEKEGYFIDIGIPEDYERAQRELKNI